MSIVELSTIDDIFKNPPRGILVYLLKVEIIGKGKEKSCPGGQLGIYNKVHTRGNKTAVRMPATVRERLLTAPCS